MKMWTYSYVPFLPIILRFLLAISLYKTAFQVVAVAIPTRTKELTSASNHLLIDDKVRLVKRITVPSVPFIRQKVINGGEMRGKISVFWSGFVPPVDGSGTQRLTPKSSLVVGRDSTTRLCQTKIGSILRR